MTYKKLEQTWVVIDVDPADLITIKEAAGILGVSVQSVAGALDRGAFTVVIDCAAHPRHGRRLLRRAEVQARVRARANFPGGGGCGGPASPTHGDGVQA